MTLMPTISSSMAGSPVLPMRSKTDPTTSSISSLQMNPSRSWSYRVKVQRSLSSRSPRTRMERPRTKSWNVHRKGFQSLSRLSSFHCITTLYTLCLPRARAQKRSLSDDAATITWLILGIDVGTRVHIRPCFDPRRGLLSESAAGRKQKRQKGIEGGEGRWLLDESNCLRWEEEEKEGREGNKEKTPGGHELWSTFATFLAYSDAYIVDMEWWSPN